MKKNGQMLLVKSMDIRNNFKTRCQIILKNENLYMVSKKEYNNLTMFNKSIKQLENSEVIIISMEESINE
jgi:hypothetical protein